jgi:hypothetical protein
MILSPYTSVMILKIAMIIFDLFAYDIIQIYVRGKFWDACQFE